MCTIPPPPPLPLPAVLPITSRTQSNLQKKTNSVTPNTNLSGWASSDPEFWELCIKNNICINHKPYNFKYRYFDSILQVGPTCGLTALSMLLNNEVPAYEMLNIAKIEGFSNNGEMFSCKDMATLTKKVLNLAEIYNLECNVRQGTLFDDGTIKELLNGAILLVPYDADFNHAPCLKQGHKAHWALVCGIIVSRNPGGSYTSDPSNINVLCKHGKSNHLAMWRLDELSTSNLNLWEFSPNRENDGLLYVLPEGGIGGKNGLRGQYLIFKYL